MPKSSSHFVAIAVVVFLTLVLIGTGQNVFEKPVRLAEQSGMLFEQLEYPDIETASGTETDTADKKKRQPNLVNPG